MTDNESREIDDIVTDNIISLPSSEIYVKVNMEDFNLIVQESLENISDRTRQALSSFIFKSNTEIDLNRRYSVEEIMEYGISFIDYYIMLKLRREGYIFNIEVDPDLPPINVNISKQAIFSIFYMIVTRAKCFPDSNETYPKFLVNHMNIPLTKDKIKEIISKNDITCLEHTWVRRVDISSMGSALNTRLKSGIAGSRQLSIFKDYQYTENLSGERLELFNKLKNLSIEGPFWEQHPLFIPQNFRNISVSKNLNNFICECYNLETRKKMHENKRLYSVPTVDNKHLSYLSWRASDFDCYINKVVNL